MNIEHTLQERGQRHGDFYLNSAIAQGIKASLRLDPPHFDELPPNVKEALHMIAHKMARIVAGDYTFTDHWHDIIGYARLIEKYYQEQSTADEQDS